MKWFYFLKKLLGFGKKEVFPEPLAEEVISNEPVSSNDELSDRDIHVETELSNESVVHEKDSEMEKLVFDADKTYHEIDQLKNAEKSQKKNS